MTTIVYKDGVLAADTRAYSGDSVPIGNKQKIFSATFPDGSSSFFGISTPAPGFSEEIRKWFSMQKHPQYLPDMNGRNFYALEINDKGEVFYYHNCFTPSGPLEAPYYAIGSGCEYALGALAVGVTAQEAVVAAAQHDAWTGGKVQHIVVLQPAPEQVEEFTEAA